MRVVGLLAWYQENPEWLREAIRSFAPSIDHLVAVDGAYAHFPGGRPASAPGEHKAIVQECKRQGIGCTLEVPCGTWETEMAKRTRLFQLGETACGPDDWYLIIDGDERLHTLPDDFRTRLAATSLDVAEVAFYEPHPNAPSKSFPLRIVFRASRGLTVKGNHWTFVTADGRKLWGHGRQEPALNVHDLVVEHLTHFRRKERKGAAKTYYRTRDDLNIEIGICTICHRQGTHEIPADWRVDKLKRAGTNVVEGSLTSTYIAVCDGCLPQAREEANAQLRALGFDPATIQVSFTHRPLHDSVAPPAPPTVPGLGRPETNGRRKVGAKA
jgi:hypothetical protein